MIDNHGYDTGPEWGHCHGITKRGLPCQNLHLSPGGYCRWHRPDTPLVPVLALFSRP